MILQQCPRILRSTPAIRSMLAETIQNNHQPKPTSEEDKLLQACLRPRDWV